MANFTYFLNRQGARGQKGEKGDQGFSPIITVATNTLSEYVLRIQTQDNTFLTANLREHKEDAGGTYIRYNRETGVMYAGAANVATTTQQGEVRFANSTEVANLDETTVVTPADVNTIVESKNYDDAIDGLDTRLTSAEGTIIDQGNAITALQGQMTGVLSNYVTTNTTQTITGNKTFSGTMTAGYLQFDNGLYAKRGSQYYQVLGIDGTGLSSNPYYVHVGGQYGLLLDSNRSTIETKRSGNVYTNIDSGNISGYLPTVPTKTSDLTNDSGFITSADLPTVGNGTITLTQGGVTKGTFTTNQSGNASIELDAAGNTLTAGSGIDITSDVVSVNYDSTKGLVATNNSLGVRVDGTTIDFDASGNLTSIASAPSNMVTTNTFQTITGSKTFNSGNGVAVGYIKSLTGYGLLGRDAESNASWLGNWNYDTELRGTNITVKRSGLSGATYINIDSGNIGTYLPTINGGNA